MLNLLSPALFVNHRNVSPPEAPSNRIWSQVQGQAISPDGVRMADGVSESFKNFGEIAPAIAGGTTGQFGGYGYYVDTATTAGSIKQAVDGSGIAMLTGGTSKHGTGLITGGNVGGIGEINLTGGKMIAFEARVKFTAAAANSLAFLVGAIKPATLDDDMITDAGVLIDTDYLGFFTQTFDDAKDLLHFGYRKTGQAVKAITQLEDEIVLGNWMKLGFVLAPERHEHVLQVFVDGKSRASFSKADLRADVSFPDEADYAITAFVKSIAASVDGLAVDWMHAVQIG